MFHLETKFSKITSKSIKQNFFLGEGKLGTDEEVFNRILAHESFPQLRLIFEEYKNIGGRTIEQATEHELSGELKEAMLAIGMFTSYFNLFPPFKKIY